MKRQMYLHAGNNKLVRTKEIIGIFDMDSATISSVTKKFLKNSEKNNKTVNITNELPKSFILTEDGRVYISQISPSALKGRINSRS